MKNELLEQVRNQIAKEKGFSSWQQFAWRLGTYSEEHDEVSFRYANEFAKSFTKQQVHKALDEAAEKILEELREDKRDAKKRVEDARVQVETHNLKYEEYSLNSYLHGQGYVQAKTGDIGFVKDVILSLKEKY